MGKRTKKDPGDELVTTLSGETITRRELDAQLKQLQEDEIAMPYRVREWLNRSSAEAIATVLGDALATGTNDQAEWYGVRVEIEGRHVSLRISPGQLAVALLVKIGQRPLAELLSQAYNARIDPTP